MQMNIVLRSYGIQHSTRVHSLESANVGHFGGTALHTKTSIAVEKTLATTTGAIHTTCSPVAPVGQAEARI